MDYAVAGGSAAHGADFTLPAGTLAFAAGETSKTITVPTTADGVTEGNETLVIALGNVTGGGVLGVLKTTTVTIRDAAQVRFSNDVVLCDLFACYAFTARLTTSGGHAWLSFTGEPSAYQPVPELRLTNPVVQAVEFGITMPFATSFAIAPSRRYAIALRASGGNPLLVLLDEGPLSLSQEGPDTAASVTATPGVPATAPPGIRFEGVTFRYDTRERPALRDVSFEVGPGETVAVVGRSGSGKSTLVALLLRFFDPAQGRIRLDGVDLRELTVASLRVSVARFLPTGNAVIATLTLTMAHSQP